MLTGKQEALAAVLSARGHDLREPPARPRAGLVQEEQRAFTTTLDRMHEADVLVADASADPMELGWALAWFLARGRLAIVACPREARAALPALVAGNPSPWLRLVVYETADDLRDRLNELLG